MRLIIPNYHVILIHFPLALLGIGILIELGSFLWRQTSFHLAGRWMILLGALLLVPATTSGIFALYDVASHGQPDGTWADVKAASGFSMQDWHLAKNHILLNSVGTGIVLLTVVGWLSVCDQSRRKYYLSALAALVVAMGLFSAGAWHGGEMVFREGFGVEGKLGTVDADAQPMSQQSWKDKIDNAISPMQIHLIVAGLVISCIAGAIGLSLRRCIADATPPPAPPMGESQAQASKSIYSLQELVAVQEAKGPPPTQFWLLAALLAFFTIILGFYVGEYFGGPKFFEMDHLKRALQHLQQPEKRRMGFHIIFGASILVLCLILALVARMRAPSHAVVGFFSLLLILVLAGQIWMGILLLYDTGQGPLTRFNPAENPLPATQMTTQP